MINIIDYGMGNLRSVQKAFERLNLVVNIANEPDELQHSEFIVLPGVGHFEQGIQNLKQKGFFNMIKEVVRDKQIPILGICLGMQMLCSHSEEGDSEGLNLIDAAVKKFPKSNLKIPHMGWNSLTSKQLMPSHFNNYEDKFVYFVHSYFVDCNNKDDVLFETSYGIPFHSAIRRNNIWGYQFHPEKSHDYGSNLLQLYLNNSISK